jgi:RsiW-degrading membrane proteinase PrsW (M82 family)
MYFVILAFICIASSLVWYLLGHDHGRKLPVATLWYACGFGVLAMVLAMAAEAFVLPRDFVTKPVLYTTGQQFFWFSIVGVVEEAAKFIPLALFIYKRPYFREHTDGCIYFAICGLTFGLGENILYTATFGAGVGIIRLLLTPFLHAATTSILGYYLVNQKIQPNKRGLFVLAAIIIPAMHGVYDFGLGAGIGGLLVLSLMITLLLTLGLFLYFMQANAQDRLASAQAPLGYAIAPALASTQHNFCASCGKPSKHQSYCEYCGHKL